MHSAILLTSLSYHMSLRCLFCLFLRGRFTQVLLYFWLECQCIVASSLWHIEHAYYAHGVLEDFKQGISYIINVFGSMINCT